MTHLIVLIPSMLRATVSTILSKTLYSYLGAQYDLLFPVILPVALYSYLRAQDDLLFPVILPVALYSYLRAQYDLLFPVILPVALYSYLRAQYDLLFPVILSIALYSYLRAQKVLLFPGRLTATDPVIVSVALNLFCLIFAVTIATWKETIHMILIHQIVFFLLKLRLMDARRFPAIS